MRAATALKRVLRLKLHDLAVTACRRDYDGSLLLAPELMAAGGLRPYDEVLVASYRGERWTTYALPAPGPTRRQALELGMPGHGPLPVILAGPSATHAAHHDRIVVMAFGQVDLLAAGGAPRLVRVDEFNRPLPEPGGAARELLP